MGLALHLSALVLLFQRILSQVKTAFINVEINGTGY